MPINNGSLVIYASSNDEPSASYQPNQAAYQIRPCPFVSISQSPIRNGMGYLGSEYTITLTGTVPFGKFLIDTSPNGTTTTTVAPSPPNIRVRYFFERQKVLSNLLSSPYLKLEFQDPSNGAAIWYCFAKLESLNFEEGTYFSKMDYTATFSANELYNTDGTLFASSKPALMQGYGYHPLPSGRALQDFNETWDFQVDDSTGYTLDTPLATNASEYIRPRSFILTRSLSATGRTEANRLASQSKSDRFPTPAWQVARDYVFAYASGNDYLFYLNSGTHHGHLGGWDNPSKYMGYNHSRTESLDKGAGSFSITDTWILAPNGSQGLESFNTSIESSADNSYIRVSIDGTVKGLSTWHPSGEYSKTGFTNPPLTLAESQRSPYANAQAHFQKISHSGNFGFNSKIYKRVNSLINPNLNTTPLSVTIGSNPITGEITYNVSYDNRPSNYFTNVVSEVINVTDTYPGDIFTVIPVIGRPTGPVLQAAFGRTEYRRDIQIEMILDYTDIASDIKFRTNRRESLLLRKPSINNLLKQELQYLISDLSPANEPGIRKYYVSAPTETWNPKDGRYTLSLSWTYELSE
jgi:hypothetical protein